jgi:hypothetical protein
MSRTRRCGGGVADSFPDGLLLDYHQSCTCNREVTLFDPVLCSERADGLRVTDRHRYNAANHFSMSVMGGRRVISPGPEDILMTRRVCPSSP